MGYLGNRPEEVIVSKIYEYVAINGQTVFFMDQTNYVEVHLNGLLLSEADYVISGTYITVILPLALGDILRIKGFNEYIEPGSPTILVGESI